MSTEAMKLALEAAYLAGFNASGEGYNGEYPFGDKNQNPEHDSVWCKDRDNALEEALAKQEQGEPWWLLESTQEVAKAMAKEFYPEVTQWKVLDDLAGVISQIDNMTTGLIRKPKQEQGEPVAVDGNTSDGYQTFNELYDFRKAYNAALFNEWAANGKCSVHKSWRHHDGELCFGGGWFIVVAVLPDGQISNHYEAKDWDLFSLPETERALFEFDGHTGADVIHRLKAYTTPQQRKPLTKKQIDKLADEDCFLGNIYEITAEIEAAHGIKE